jgi:hypothetical protein
MPCDVVAISAIAGAGALGTAFDLRARRVPNPLTFGVALTGLVFADEHLTMLSPGAALAGLLFGLLLMLPGHVFGATHARAASLRLHRDRRGRSRRRSRRPPPAASPQSAGRRCDRRHRWRERRCSESRIRE